MRRSMDAVRYVYGDEECIDAVKANGGVLSWECSNCGHVNSLEISKLEERIESEERDPDVEYLMCECCGEGSPITNGSVEAVLYKSNKVLKGKITSDGYFTYLRGVSVNVRLN